MSKQKLFGKGDLIFAKVRGYPAWPARVESQIGSPNPKYARYKVFFYGTYQTAVCKAEEVFSFEESKGKMGTPKNHKFFNEAMCEIEKNPDIGAPVNKDSPPSSPEQVVDSEDEEDEKPLNKPLKTGGKRMSVSSSPSETHQNKKLKMSTPISNMKNIKNETPLKVDSDDEKVKTNSSTKIKFAFKTKTLKIAVNTEANKSDSENDDDHDSETSSPEYSDIVPDQMKDEMDDEVVVKMSRREALNLLSDDDLSLSLRNKVCETLMTRFIVKQNVTTPKYIVQFLKGELKLLTIDRKITGLFARNKVGDVPAALVLLDELESVKMQPLMLKKNPRIVDTIYKLTRYTGCVEQWGLGQEAERKFLKDASKLREKAYQIYQQMKGLFSLPEDTNFIAWLIRESNHLRAIMSSSEKFITMTQEPTVIDLESDEEIDMVPLQQQTGDDKNEAEICKKETHSVTAETEESGAAMSRPPLQSLPLNNSLPEEME